eukprot:Gb_07143 [translate_table: standard]
MTLLKTLVIASLQCSKPMQGVSLSTK